MADEKKSRSERMYGKGPKIEKADGGSATKQEEPAHKEAEKTAGKPEKSEPSPKKEPVKPTPAGGAETPLDLPGEGMGGGQMPMGDVHDREMKDMHHRHERERRDMHTRHETEHKEMRDRHEKEYGVSTAPAKGKDEHIDGNDGTEPK